MILIQPLCLVGSSSLNEGEIVCCSIIRDISPLSYTPARWTPQSSVIAQKKKSQSDPEPRPSRASPFGSGKLNRMRLLYRSGRITEKENGGHNETKTSRLFNIRKNRSLNLYYLLHTTSTPNTTQRRAPTLIYCTLRDATRVPLHVEDKYTATWSPPLDRNSPTRIFLARGSTKILGI